MLQCNLKCNTTTISSSRHGAHAGDNVSVWVQGVGALTWFSESRDKIYFVSTVYIHTKKSKRS